jgi:hypothetical protein
MKNIEKLLKSVEKPKLTDKKKLMIKENILFYAKNCEQARMMVSYSGIVRAIRSAVASVKIDNTQKVSIKESLMDMIENHSQKRFFWSNFAAFHKSFAGAMAAVFLFFGFFNFVSVNPTVVNAGTLTVLSDFEGGVLIERDGEFIDPYIDLVLEAGDRITTMEDSLAEIQYFDDSVTRLDNDTRIVINSLDRTRNNVFSSYVEISVLDGAVWSRVINLVEDKSEFVVKAASIYATTQRGAFNVEIADDEVEVGVFTHAVQIQSNNNFDKVISGEKLTLHKTSNLSQKEKINFDEKSEDWVKSNLINDDIYIANVEDKLLVAKMEALGVESEDEVEFDTTLKESTALFLTFDDVKKSKLKLDLAEKNFIAAQVKLNDSALTSEEKEELDEVFAEFTATFDDFYTLVDDVQTRDEGYAEDLKSYAEDKILSQQKHLASVKPHNPVFIAKTVLNDLEVMVADNDEELLAIRQDQAVEKLYLVENAVNEGDYDLAEEIVEDYKDDLSVTAEIIDSLGDVDEQRDEAVEKFVDSLNDDLYVLTAIDEVAEEADEDLADAEDAYEVLEIAVSLVKEEVVEQVDVVESVTVEVTTEEETVADETQIIEEEIVEIIPVEESIIDGPFGISIQGDKPLGPLFKEY